MNSKFVAHAHPAQLKISTTSTYNYILVDQQQISDGKTRTQDHRSYVLRLGDLLSES